MTNKDLKNGDIIITRGCLIGIWIETGKSRFLLYQNGGYDEDCFINDDLTNDSEEEYDIMLVYREPDGRPLTFTTFDDDGMVMFDRDPDWNPESLPKDLSNRNLINELVKEQEAKEADGAPQEKRITIVAQMFYGNRTVTDIDADDIDRFILGYIEKDMEITEPIDRSIIEIPNSNDLVLIYNKYREAERLIRKEEIEKEEDYELKPSAVIPELGITLYSRCIVCRRYKNGNFDSIYCGVGDVLNKYLPT